MRPEEPSGPPTLDYATPPATSPWRMRLAVAFAPSAGLAAGYALSFAGVGFFPAWFFFSLAGPAVVCLVAPRRRVAVAVLFPLAMMLCMMIWLVTAPRNPYGPSPAGMVALLGVLTFLSVLFAAGIAAMFGPGRRAA